MRDPGLVELCHLCPHFGEDLAAQVPFPPVEALARQPFLGEKPDPAADSTDGLHVGHAHPGALREQEQKGFVFDLPLGREERWLGISEREEAPQPV